ncbi:MAG: MFS transporter [Bradyrhizobium sp.]
MSQDTLKVVSPLDVAAADSMTGPRLWVVIGSALGLTFGFGPIFFSTAGIFLKPMAESFQWTRADVAILPMLAMTGTAIGAPIAGYVADRIGWSKVIGLGMILFAAFVLALAFAPASRLYVATAGFAIGLAGAATTAAGYLAILPRVFDSRLGMALGLGMLGTGVGGFLAPIVAGRLSVIYGWRASYMIFAALALVFGVIAHRIIFTNLPEGERMNSMRSQERSELTGLSLTEALGTFRFWLIAVVMFLVSMVILGGFVHLAPFATDRGLGSDVAASAAGIVGAGLAISRVGAGFILDRFFAPFIALVAFILGAIGFVILVTIPNSPGLLLTAALLLGVSTGTEGDLIPYLARKYFGKRALGAIYGALFGAATIGGAAGPFLYGLTFDYFKSYTPIHQLSAVICVVCAAAILALGRYPAAYPRQGGTRVLVA